MVFQMMQQQLGDTLLDSYTDGVNFRMYVTRDSQTDDLAIWAINFSETDDKTVRLNLSGLDLIDGVRLKKLANLTGDTSLFDRNDSPTSPAVGWTEQALTGFDPASFVMTFEDATLSVLVIEQTPPVVADRDRDGDVDQSDFGCFQACLTGAAVAQHDPSCQWARLDSDGDVDAADLNLFIGCASGPDVRANTDCLP